MLEYGKPRRYVMGYPTKVQRIHRKKTADQYYINFPTAVAEAMEFEKGEIIEWIIEDKANIIAHRRHVPPSPITVKKTLLKSSQESKNS
jgi:hypothetical protein